MSDKIKPWHQRKPKHHGKNERHKSKFPPNGGKRYDNYPPRTDDRKSPPPEEWDDQPLRW